MRLLREFFTASVSHAIGMLGRSSANHDWLLANASACVSCGFSLRTQRKRLRLNGNRAPLA